MPATGSRRAKRDGEVRVSVPPAAARPGEDEHLSPHHRQTREHGVNRAVYWTVRFFLQPVLHIYFRLSRTGHKHIPDGPVILAANHRSFLDPFIVGTCLFRPVYFVAKKELFDKPWQGWLLNRLGAFPVKRGQSDEEMMQTALALLERGEAVVIFPEGTRHREGPLQEPRRGVGRLALESGAPVVPIAITGTENARRGWRIRPVKVSIRCGRPLRYPRVIDPSAELAGEVTARIWPCVELQWAWLGGPLATRDRDRPDGPGRRSRDRERSAA
jgi:glycerol-3-phosphate dehydrogenase (NAD(P)+)